MVAKYVHNPSEHVRLFWIKDGTRKGIGVFCRGVQWFDFPEPAKNLAASFRKRGIASYSVKFRRGTGHEWLVFVEDGLTPEQNKQMQAELRALKRDGT